MVSIREQTVLITGSTDGIGKLVAMELAKRGTGILIHGRDLTKCRLVRDEIYKSSGNPKVEYYLADFSSLHDVEHMIEDINENHHRLDVLINNAGVLPVHREGERRHLSAQEHDLCFSVNYLAPFLLTHRLIPLLQAAPKARVVNVASVAQEAIDFDDLTLTSNYSPMRAYARSKLSLIMFTFELAQRLEGQNITVNCLHPGSLLDTKMVRNAFSHPQGSAQTGADALIYLATAPELDGVSGAYFDGKNEARAHDQAYDEKARSALYRVSLQLTGLAEHRK